MRYASSRPVGRLCCWAILMIGACGLAIPCARAAGDPQGGPATTTVTDTVYSADGSAAQGTLIIEWPAFVTAGGTQVANGTTSVSLASNGTFSVALVPNAGATPAGVYYTVVYQIGPGAVRTEYWLVPTTSPANLAAVRITPGSGTAAAPVSLEYVNSELATKANDSAVVHLAGTETISGTKTFSAAPSAPTPTASGQIATKAYVDSSVSNVGAGNFLAIAGGTMTGPITLPGSPVAALQAATKLYVDTVGAAKADLVAGLVPASELGTGLATSGTCLQGNGSWGACGSGTGNLSTAPTANQTIAQPEGTQFSTNNLANIRYVTSNWNWAQTPSDNLTSAGAATIHLSPCPLGIDTASTSNYYSYKVYISGTGTAEAVLVTGGSCTPGASSGTITVTTTHAHAAGYTVGSATGGIQEAWNDAWVNDQGAAPNANSQAGPYVKLSADVPYNVYSSIYLRGRGGILDGAGALIVCSTRDRCIYVGTTQGVPAVNHHKIYNLSGTSTVNVDGVQVAGVAASSGTYTVTTASAHSFVAGDTVDCEYHSQTADQHWSSPVVGVPNSTSFTVSFGHSTFAAGTATFGFCNLLNAFLEDNSDHVAVQDINIFQSNPAGEGYFTYGIVNDNDQEFIVERASNRSSGVLNATANWPIGAFFYERTDQSNAGITYVHDSEITGVNCATGGGNGMVVTDTVCQGFPTYGIRYFGGLQPVTLQNIYEESTGGSVNPLYGYAAQDGFLLQGGTGNKILGTFPVSGLEPGFAAGGGGAAERTYFVVPRSSTLGYGPVLFIGWAEPVNGIVSIPLTWPSVELQNNIGQSLGTLTWDVLVTTGSTAAPPWGSGMYVIATNISGSCGTNGMCSFTDTQAAPGAYTVAAQQFQPLFWFWPVNMAINGTTVLVEQVGADPSAVASQGTLGVSIVAEQCRSAGVSRRRSPIWISCLTSEPSGGSGSIATVLQEQDAANNGPALNSKGRLNFGKAIGAPNDLITLLDSNLAKTLATSGERPSNDTGDMAIGLDQTGGLAQRAATSVSSYINVIPTGANWLERLSGTQKAFQVPVTTTGGITAASLGPYSNTSSPLCIVDGVNNATIASCEIYLGMLGFASSGTIWSFVPEDFTSDPFVNFHGTIMLGHQTGTGDTCATAAPFTCYMTEVPLTMPTHLTIMGQQNPSRSQGPFNQGTILSFGSSYPAPLGVPANATNWTGTGNHTPDFSCIGTGGALTNGTYYVQLWEALDRTSGTGGANKTPGYSAATAEVAVTCANGTSTQSIQFHAPTAAGSGAFAAKDFFAGTATVPAVNGAGQEQSNLVGTQWACPGAAGSLDATFGCTITAGLATIKAVPAVSAMSGNPPPLVDLSTCFIAMGTGTPGVTPNAFGVKLQHLTLSGMSGGVNTTTPAANEPSCSVLGWTAQDQSGPEDITWTGPWINTAFYSGYKSGNSYARHLHMPSNEGPGQSGLTFYPMIVDGRGLGNGGIRTLEDSSIAMRCSGCSQQPTEPYSVWMTGNAVGLHAHGIHVENDVGGDGFFVDNLASLDLSSVTGFGDVNHYLAHFSATAEPSCATETKVGKNGGVADDATGYTNSGFNSTAFRYCTLEASGGHSLTTGVESTTQTAGQSTGIPYKVVSLNSSGSVVVNNAGSNNAFGIAQSGITSGSPVEVATLGSTFCIPDNATTVNDLAGVSTSTGGSCTDLGQSDETQVAVGTQILGRFKTAVSSGVNAGLQLFGPGHYGASAVGGSSITAVSGTFSGNVSISGQLLVAGPWTVSSPIPGTAMSPASTGTSALGISNDGNFYISQSGGTPQEVATTATSSYFSNLTQEDTNDLGEFNGTNPQGLHVYGTYTNSSNYERTGLGWDPTNGVFVVKNENLGTGAQRGLGFAIGGSTRWMISTSSELKPLSNNSFNIGDANFAPQTIYAATSFDTLTSGRLNFELCNDGTTGTSLNFLAVYNSATPSCAVKAGTSNTDGLIGIVSNGSGTTLNAVITYRGYVPCSFDGSTTAGDFVVASTSNGGDCHDAGAARPTGVQVLGRVESTNTGVGTYGVRLSLDAPAGAPLASPGFTGTPTAPTAAANTNTTQVATTAFAHAVVPPDASSSVWMTVSHSSSSGTVFSSSANKAAFFGAMLGYQKTTSQVSYYVATADTSSTTYDLGIYSGTSAGTCTLMAHTGSIAGSTAMTAGAHTVNWTGGSVTLQPGRYYLALTASATSSTAVLYGDSAGVTFAGGTGTSNVGNVSVTSGGTLPASVTCPTDTVQVAALIPAWLVD